MKYKYNITEYVRVTSAISRGLIDSLSYYWKRKSYIGQRGRVRDTQEVNGKPGYILELDGYHSLLFTEDELSSTKQPKSIFVIGNGYGKSGWIYNPWDLEQLAKNILEDLKSAK